VTPRSSGVAAFVLSCLLTGALAGTGAASPSPASPTPRASPDLARMTVSPAEGFVGGQAQVYEGNIGVPGRRTVWLEANLNRPGDRWGRLPGTESRTNRHGDFRIVRPAPSMFKIRYRVKGQGGFKAPDTLLNPETQELLIWAAAQSPSRWKEAVHPGIGQPFVVAVDTTPRQLHRTDVDHLPVFAGRPLTLQRRITPVLWEDVATTTVGDNGMGYFDNIVEDALGEVVYRVRQERIHTGADRIGWHASFPLTLTVGPVPVPFSWWEKTETDTFNVRGFKAARTASKRYGWGRKHFDFDWDQGHDLDSPPTRGRRLEGGWRPFSDGAGRASAQNGQLVLFSSVSGRASTGDFGTTRATHSGKPRKYGRWEVRMRWQVLESGVPDYRIRLDLVPASQSEIPCPDRSITIGTWSPRDASYAFGFSDAERHWTGSTSFPDLSFDNPAMAVEVAKDHTTWFVDGQPVGSVPGKRRQVASRMVLRMSLEGVAGDAVEHASTKVFSDWQRGFGMNFGRQVLSANRLPRTSTGLCADQPTLLSPVQN
jgi:hypothetical protein